MISDHGTSISDGMMVRFNHSCGNIVEYQTNPYYYTPCCVCGYLPCQCLWYRQGISNAFPVAKPTKAFQLAKKMVEEKIIQVETVQRFIELVELIEKEL